MPQVVQQALLNKARPVCNTGFKYYTCKLAGSKVTKCILHSLADYNKS